MAALKRRSKTLSPEWLQFAEKIVTSAGIIDEGTQTLLVEAFSGVPRDKFVIESAKIEAFEDKALPALHAQVCEKPSWIARVLGLVGIAPGMKVLELGGGSGYASAVMAQAGAHVFSVEDVALVAQRTRKLLDSLYLHNVILRHAEAKAGWADQGPFDAIVSWCVLEQVEQDLLAQLVSPGGRLVTRIGMSATSRPPPRRPTRMIRTQQPKTVVSGPSVLSLWETREQGSVFYQLEQCE